MGTHEIIKIFDSVFSGIDLPACISLVDNNGLLIYSVGECADQWVLESLFSYLIMSFELTQDKLKLTSEQIKIINQEKHLPLILIDGKYDNDSPNIKTAFE